MSRRRSTRKSRASPKKASTRKRSTTRFRTSSMRSRPGCRRRIERRTWLRAEAVEARYPLAAQIRVRADKEVTVVEGVVHRDNVEAYTRLLLERVLEPRFADDDFARNRQDAMDALAKTLRGNDDENLGK